MKAAPAGFMSRAQYRAWCAAQPTGRFERVDGRIVAMAAERVGHVRVKAAVWLALRRAIATAGLDCEALADGVTVEVGESDYEPDALVNCGGRIADDELAAPQPVVIVEVLSPGTASTDTGGKLADYFKLPSVAHYLIVHPGKRLVVHHRREEDGISTRIVVSGEIVLAPPGLSLEMDAIYNSGQISDV